jgi:hypothetical protein
MLPAYSVERIGRHSKTGAAYNGLHINEAARLAVSGTHRVAQSWHRAKPSDRKSLEERHRQAADFVGDLVCWNMTETYSDSLDLLRTERGGTALVFGGGIGGEAVRFSEQRNEVWFCELPDTPVRKFAEWRSQRHGYDWRFVSEIPSESDVLDCAAAFNVFGSLTPNVVRDALRRIAVSLKPGGRFYCRHDWAERDAHPYIRDNEATWQDVISRLPLRMTFDSRPAGSAAKGYHCILVKHS